MNLPEHLKVYLATLRADLPFREIMAAVTRTRLKAFQPNSDPEKAKVDLIYRSGRLAGERDIMIEVLGYDPNDRLSE